MDALRRMPPPSPELAGAGAQAASEASMSGCTSPVAGIGGGAEGVAWAGGPSAVVGGCLVGRAGGTQGSSKAGCVPSQGAFQPAGRRAMPPTLQQGSGGASGADR